MSISPFANSPSLPNYSPIDIRLMLMLMLMLTLILYPSHANFSSLPIIPSSSGILLINTNYEAPLFVIGDPYIFFCVLFSFCKSASVPPTDRINSLIIKRYLLKYPDLISSFNQPEIKSILDSVGSTVCTAVYNSEKWSCVLDHYRAAIVGTDSV